MTSCPSFHIVVLPSLMKNNNSAMPVKKPHNCSDSLALQNDSHVLFEGNGIDVSLCFDSVEQPLLAWPKESSSSSNQLSMKKIVNNFLCVGNAKVVPQYITSVCHKQTRSHAEANCYPGDRSSLLPKVAAINNNLASHTVSKMADVATGTASQWAKFMDFGNQKSVHARKPREQPILADEQQRAASPVQTGQQGTPPPGQTGQEGTPSPVQAGHQGTPPPGQSGQRGTPPMGHTGQEGMKSPVQAGHQGTPSPVQAGHQGTPPPGQTGQHGTPSPVQAGHQGTPSPVQIGQEGVPSTGQTGQEGVPSTGQAGQQMVPSTDALSLQKPTPGRGAIQNRQPTLDDSGSGSSRPPFPGGPGLSADRDASSREQTLDRLRAQLRRQLETRAGLQREVAALQRRMASGRTAGEQPLTPRAALWAGAAGCHRRPPPLEHIPELEEPDPERLRAERDAAVERAAELDQAVTRLGAELAAAFVDCETERRRAAQAERERGDWQRAAAALSAERRALLDRLEAAAAETAQLRGQLGTGQTAPVGSAAAGADLAGPAGSACSDSDLLSACEASEESRYSAGAAAACPWPLDLAGSACPPRTEGGPGESDTGALAASQAPSCDSGVELAERGPGRRRWLLQPAEQPVAAAELPAGAACRRLARYTEQEAGRLVAEAERLRRQVAELRGGLLAERGWVPEHLLHRAQRHNAALLAQLAAAGLTEPAPYCPESAADHRQICGGGANSDDPALPGDLLRAPDPYS